MGAVGVSTRLQGTGPSWRRRLAGYMRCCRSPQCMKLSSRRSAPRESAKSSLRSTSNLPRVCACSTWAVVGDLIEHLPGVRYTGTDLSAAYVASARRRFGHLGRFYVGRVQDLDSGEIGEVDVIIAKSLLHHIDENEAMHLFEVASNTLANGGRLVTVDAAYTSDMSPAARFVVSRDEIVSAPGTEHSRARGLRGAGKTRVRRRRGSGTARPAPDPLHARLHVLFQAASLTSPRGVGQGSPRAVKRVKSCCGPPSTFVRLGLAEVADPKSSSASRGCPYGRPPPEVRTSRRLSGWGLAEVARIGL